jgi:hypothetical protein
MKRYPDKFIDLNLVIAGKQVQIKYMGKFSNIRLPITTVSGQEYKRGHNYALIINQQYIYFF